MQAAEVGDLLEAEGGVVDQPDRGGLGHQDVAHGLGSRFFWARAARCGGRWIRRRPAFRPGADDADIGLFGRKENAARQGRTAKVHVRRATLAVLKS
ncbi:MAG: hypothetical protein DI552_01290 [Brevundimonas sp.]|nr:MAG: hypothetical protein DI552_01290 [Brevundimonas sp.]